MNLLVDYIQPLTTWLQQHPHWALLITFIISLSESLAIIGSIVPGSVTMTAIGILAGSGIMRIDLTLLAAILGAIAGDSISYAIGYVYSERLTDVWPFKKYPKWFQYGKDFFALHGGKSVLLGRFIGPLRSLIPIIAGILHMSHWRFFIANVISAIGWSILYVMPGVIIGTASHELSPESATRLFVLILIILALIWAISVMFKWLVNLLSSFFKRHLHYLWLKLKNSSTFGSLCNFITPKNEKNHYTTASLALITLLCLFNFTALLGLVIQTQWISTINLPVHLFIQSFHIFILKAFFIFCTQLTSTLTISVLFVICCIWFIYYKNLKAIFYLSSLMIVSNIITFLLSYYVDSARPSGLLIVMSGSSFPAINLMIATAFYGLILFLINQGSILLTNTLRTCVFTILGLSGLGALYLGDYWLTDILAAYFGGAALGFIYCLVYRKYNIPYKKMKRAGLMIFSLLFATILASTLSFYLNFHTLTYNHLSYRKEFSLSETTWWSQSKPILPIYRLNRIGKRTSILNIEYCGDLSSLEEALKLNGWQSRNESFFTNLLLRIGNESNGVKLPLLTQLYENKAPELIMTYIDKNSKLTLELRMWESNYYLSESNKPLWIGSIHPSTAKNNKHPQDVYYSKLINPLEYFSLSKKTFNFKKLIIPDLSLKRTSHPTEPYILLIKKNDNREHQN